MFRGRPLPGERCGVAVRLIAVTVQPAALHTCILDHRTFHCQCASPCPHSCPPSLLSAGRHEHQADLQCLSTPAKPATGAPVRTAAVWQQHRYSSPCRLSHTAAPQAPERLKCACLSHNLRSLCSLIGPHDAPHTTFHTRMPLACLILAHLLQPLHQLPVCRKLHSDSMYCKQLHSARSSKQTLGKGRRQQRGLGRQACDASEQVAGGRQKQRCGPPSTGRADIYRPIQCTVI